MSCRLYLNRVQFENRSPASRTKAAGLQPDSLTTSKWDYWSQTGRALAADEAAALLNAAQAATKPPKSSALRLLGHAAVVTAGYAIAEGTFTA
jgi:hypothetical protein